MRPGHARSSHHSRRSPRNVAAFGPLSLVSTSAERDVSETPRAGEEYRCHQLGYAKSLSREIWSEMFLGLPACAGPSAALDRARSEQTDDWAYRHAVRP